MTKWISHRAKKYRAAKATYKSDGNTFETYIVYLIHCIVYSDSWAAAWPVGYAWEISARKSYVVGCGLREWFERVLAPTTSISLQN